MDEHQSVMRGEVEKDLEETTVSEDPWMTHTTALVS